MLELLNRFSKRIKMPVVMDEPLFWSSAELIQAVGDFMSKAGCEYRCGVHAG